MANSVDIRLYGSSLKIVRQCGPTLCKVLESKFGCVPTFDGVDFESDLSAAQQKKPTVVPEKRFDVKLPSGVTVSVWKADLTNLLVDAVVNAANTSLQHYGGLAEALSTAGGPQIQRDSNDHTRSYGNLNTGDAVVTAAGLLPCKMIIHAVGPELPRYPLSSEVKQAEPQLRKAIWSVLDRVQEYHLKRVAIPAISSGLFHYPLQECARTIVLAVKDYYDNQSSQRHLPDEILLVNIDEPTVREMEKACCQILAHQQPMTYSQAVGSSSSSSGGGGVAITSSHTVKIGNVLLKLKKGKIEEQQTDVIVNTTSSDLNLSSGEISKALLQKAGSEMQRAIRTVSSPNQYVIPTKSYRLRCKEVYHTRIVPGTYSSREVFYKSVLDCLWRANAAGHKSIAFPAIGTGGLGFTKKEAAQIMSETVANFAQKSLKMMEVHFVILPSDDTTFKAFEEQLRFLQTNASHPSFTHAFEQRHDFREFKPPTPRISLSGPSPEATHEAQRWLNILYESLDTVKISNNFIQHFGEQEYLQLSHLTKQGINIEEYFDFGHASITVRGASNEDAVVVMLKLEAMLCDIQREFVRDQECAMLQMLQLPAKSVSYERKAVSDTSSEFRGKRSAFKDRGLRMVKLEKVENPTLKSLFDYKQKQLQDSTSRKMFQRIPAQFCDMVCHIGFHAEYAPPKDPAYGEGIYFAGKVKKAMEVWKEQNEEYLYFVEAEVLTGKSAPGRRGLILPPALSSVPHILYDSVSEGNDISVIFSGYQALPKYIITCKVISSAV